MIDLEREWIINVRVGIVLVKIRFVDKVKGEWKGKRLERERERGERVSFSKEASELVKYFLRNLML